MTAEPSIRKFPTEIFGFSYTEHGDDARQALEAQSCPFLSDICKKPRKSEPQIKVGVCSTGYQGRFLDRFHPVIICPHRFLQDGAVFATIERLYILNGNRTVQWVSEVSIGTAGSVDYVAVKLDVVGTAVEDFLCVEFQAAGTTGTPWPAVLDFKENRSFSRNSYDYGINWANEFVKTMMQQVYKKGRVIQSWNRKIIFVVQDVAIEYLHSAVDTSGLRDANDNDPIHFVTFGMEWQGGTGWKLVHNGSYSTDLAGVNRILGGAMVEDFPTEETFKSNVYSKLIGIL
jgi:hypothetical protein